MSDDASDLVALLGSRICHDLVSPLGAIGNGVELLEMSGLGESPELALITESVNCANARIRYFRIAYGAATPDQTIRLSEITETLASVGQTRRITITWQGARDVPRDEARLIFLLVQCLETSLSWGGAVTITDLGDRWELSASAERLRPMPELWSSLDEAGRNDVAPSEVHFPLARLAAHGLGRTLVHLGDETGIKVSF